MRIDFKGKLEDKPELRIGVIGCGSHSFRNIFPVFQFVRAKLVATCDYSLDKAKLFCETFGGENYYDDHKDMLAKARLDAVLMIVGNNEFGRPMYPQVAIDCMRAGAHAWVEKPPATLTGEIEEMMRVSKETGKTVMVGYKKIFVQANMKAKELAHSADFGGISMVALQNPEIIPSVDELRAFLVDKKPDETVMMFMEHLCHPVSQMISLLGAPQRMLYERTQLGSGIVIFHFPGDIMATLHFMCGMSMNGGVERTVIVSRQGVESNGRYGGRHIIVDNNLTLTYHRNAGFGYGDETNFYKGGPDENTAVWQPEFSRGQMFNKGLFLLGYYGEVEEFVSAILDDRAPTDGTIEQAWIATHIFEKFIEGPGKMIELKAPPSAN
ncbi:MAG: Gfo/Idh/MocA family oxidoreductase [Oscillospiraceae bacterium]|nr:Gfo/Idh/MocA family oxidoreductase [Oscillospiraceae bacterium]